MFKPKFFWLALICLILMIITMVAAISFSRKMSVTEEKPANQTSSPAPTVSPEKQKNVIPEFTTQELFDLWIAHVKTPEKKQSQTEFAQLKDKRIRVSGFIIFIASTEETKSRKMLLAPAKEEINRLREGMILYADSNVIYALLWDDKLFKKTIAWKAGDAVIIEGIVEIAETPHQILDRNLGAQLSPRLVRVMLAMTIEKAEKIP